MSLSVGLCGQDVVCPRMLYVRELCVQGKVLCVCECAGVNVVCIEV